MRYPTGVMRFVEFMRLYRIMRFVHACWQLLPMGLESRLRGGIFLPANLLCLFFRHHNLHRI